ncbi:MAG: potassium channel family protein [bacterium]
MGTTLPTTHESPTESTDRPSCKENKIVLEGYMSPDLDPVIPEQVRNLEDHARKEMLLRHFEISGKQFHNLANWYEGQNESIFRNKWEKAGNLHFMSAECFAACAENEISGENWHELAGLEYCRAVECYLNNPEDIYFHREAFVMGIRQFKMIQSDGQTSRFTRDEEAGKLSHHLIDVKYKKILRMLEERDFAREYSRLTIEHTKWKAKISTSTFQKLWYWFWGLTSNYGTSVIRWIVWCLFVISFYTCFYFFTYLETDRGLTGFSRIIERFYFSVVTFTTLGFGDILPQTSFGMCLVITEVLIGNLMFWVMMTILGKKIFH